MIELTVGLCSRNRRESLALVLNSLRTQSLEADRYQVVVVDDGSCDDTGAMISAMKPTLPYLLDYCFQPHSGLATARNTGLRVSRGRVVLYIDDDVLADTDLLAQHLETHTRYNRCVCNGWVNHISTPVRPSVPQFTMADISTSFFWTSNVSVKLEHLLEAGGFDERFTEYGWEDQELGLRLMAIGLVKRNNYRAVGYHIKRPPVRANIPNTLAQAQAKARSAIIYIKKHPRMRSRLSTGLIPHRLAWAELANWGRALETFCRIRLDIDAEGQLRSPLAQPDRELTRRELWCLRHLCSILYFRGLMRDGRT